MGIASSAFTINHHSGKIHPTTLTWFRFSGSDPTNPTQVKNSMNYTWTDGQPCSGPTNKICAVQVDGVASQGQHPASSFSPALQGKLQDVIDGTAKYPTEITERAE
jgi:hypothetical protein